MNPLFCTKPKRKYKLSRRGRASLRAAARKTQPWKHATGPRTETGKMIVSQNALKHGLFARDANEHSAGFKAHLRKMRVDARIPPVNTAAV
jgi:hypothetical protein